MPILELDGKLVFESLITVEFLEEAYPSSRLLYSTDPFQRARDRIFVELFNKVIFACIISKIYKLLLMHCCILKVTRAWFKLYRADRNDESSWKIPISSIENGLRVFEEELANRKSAYFGG